MVGEPRPFEVKQEKLQDLLRRALCLESDMTDIVKKGGELKDRIDKNIERAKAISTEAEEFVEDFEKPETHDNL